MTANPLLLCEDVSYSYDSGSLAIQGLNLTVHKGEFVAILGPNGSGKSTLAKHFNALLLPSGGRVLVKGMDTRAPEFLWEIRRLAGMVFQNPDNQLVATHVEEDVAFGPENLGIPSQVIRQRISESLAAAGLEGFERREAHRLSGGQKQRVAIAGVLAMRPECIILDEATAMLDPAGRREVLDTVRRLNREDGMTVIYITHFMDEAIHADRVVLLDQGRILIEGSPREVFSRVEEVKAAGLEVPAVTEICYRLNRMGIDVPADLLTVDELVKALCPE